MLIKKFILVALGADGVYMVVIHVHIKLYVSIYILKNDISFSAMSSVSLHFAYAKFERFNFNLIS